MLLSHVVYVCQKTFSNVIFTLSHSGPLFLIILVATILLIGMLTLTVLTLKTRRYLKKNLSRQVLISSALKSIIHELNLDGKMSIVKDNNKFSFCFGLIKPKICLSTGLLRSLTENELKSVLLHESYHLKNYDPLKILLGKTSTVMFFFIPVFGDIQKYYAFSKEIAADDVVIKSGNKNSLISVLSKLMTSPPPKFAGVAAFINMNDLEKRILYLSGKQIKNTFKPSSKSILLSTFVVVFSLIIVNAPVYAVNLHEESMDNHTLFICPFGDTCSASCKAEKEVNFSKNILYTPKDASK
jgi:beta-lactamase regulating signal transducer with metallopeptidase domain